MEKKISRFFKLYPWYYGFNGDLLFYIAIDTLFLTLVKNFSAAQIVSLSSISQFICIALQFPLLFIIKRIGNTASARVGSTCLLLSAVFITVCKNYYLVLLGRVFHDVAGIFFNASVVTLENNLELADRRGDFVKIRTNGNTVYAVVTLLISFVASYLFNLHPYVPMVGCISCCTVGLVLSFFMKDYSAFNRITTKGPKREKVKFRYGWLIILAVVIYALFYPLVNEGQSIGKLYIQQELLARITQEDTALIIGVVVCISRLIRVLSNIVFARLYRKYKYKVGIALPALLGFALCCQLFGAMIPYMLLMVIVMAMGYIIILFARDPFRLYMQDVIFEHTPKEQHQTLLTMMAFGVKVGTAGMGLAFSGILLSYPMSVVITIMLAITIIEVLLSLKLYSMIRAARKVQPSG